MAEVGRWVSTSGSGASAWPIADELGMIASPLMTVQRRAGDLVELRDLATAKDVDRMVLGLPTGLSGREGPQAATVRAFARALEAAVGPVIASNSGTSV